MTFRRQVFWTSLIGALALGFGSLLAVASQFLIASEGEVNKLATIAGYLLVVAFVLLVFGVIMRVLQRWFLLKIFMPSVIYTDAQKRRAVMWPMRWLWHVDKQGRDLDALDGSGRADG